jgi:NAD(P) transhydrogenase
MPLDDPIPPDRWYDLIAIGSGPAGSSGALAAAHFGKRVALVERTPLIGGAGLNTGTVPSKALRESALLLSGWRSRRLLGLDLSVHHQATIGEFTYHSLHVQRDLRALTDLRLKHHHIDRYEGTASFVDAHTLRIRGTDGAEIRLRGEHILIATGSSPVRPPLFPFDHTRVHDSDELLDISRLPERLVIVGAGVIGSEYACTFAALGVEVHLVDRRSALFPFLDQEITTVIAHAMQQARVRFHWRTSVTACRGMPDGDVLLTFDSGETLACTDVLVAAGRTSNTARLDLAAAGITPGKRGLIPVNDRYQTVVPHIYAAGDVIGPPALAATGMEQARVAISHAFGLLPKETTPLLPTGIYTIPEASMAGQTEQQVRDSGLPYLVGRGWYRDNPRGRLIGDEHGLLKLLFRRDDLRLLGVHAVGEQATELVHIGLLALLMDGDAHLFNRACFNYPTLGDLYKHAAYDAIAQHLGMRPIPPLSH